MKKGLFFVLFFALAAAAGHAQMVINVGNTTDWQGYMNGYYGVPPQTAVVYENQLGSWQDVATALFIAKVAHTTPERIIALRQAQTPWATIAQDVNVSPDVLYVPPVDNTVYRQGPPYGHAWGYWRKHSTSPVVFTDEQFKNRAVLLGTSRFYGIPVSQEFRTVQQGTPVITIVHQKHAHPGKGHGNKDHGNGNEGNRGNGNGNGHGNGKGHGHGND